jgi:hypothetical protein
MTNKDSSVERMKKSLYDRNKKPKLKDRRSLHDKKYSVSDKWEDDNVKSNVVDVENMSPDEVLDELRSGHIPGEKEDDLDILKKEKFDERSVGERTKSGITSRMIKILFGLSFLFFVFALIFAGYFLFGGKNQVSCDNIILKISGANTVASGKNLTLDIVVVNNNPVLMKNAYLDIYFPDGTRNAEITSANMPSLKKEIGTIEVGEKVRTTVQAILFGQEHTDKEITATVSYKIDDSDASFSCEEKHRVYISTSPVTLSVDGLEEISSGQELDLEVSVTSNSEETIPDLRLVADYPYGFEFVSSEPEPSEGNNVWDIGDVPQGVVRTLKLSGIVRGQGTESRRIVFSVGTKGVDDSEKLASVLQKIEHPILLTKPFIDLNLKLNDTEGPQTISNIENEVHGVLHWKNNLDYALHDVEIDAVFDGAILNLASVHSGKGFFRSIDKTITWTPQTFKKFRKLEAGEEGSLAFRFKANKPDLNTGITNPTIGITFNARARRISDNITVPESLKDQSRRKVLFNTNLFLESYALYATGPMKNTGPHPPRVDEETTYTVVWNIKNTTNDLSSVVVTGELPVNIKWMNSVDADNGNSSLTFNPVTRKVTWSVGDVSRSTGFQTSPRTAYFQVSVVPSISQVGDELTLLSDSRARGVDTFTKDVINVGPNIVTTKLYKDPYFKDVWGLVQ